METINVNGINLNVAIKGSGHPLILIHGLGADNTHWEDETNRLSANFRTIALDCRGHGQSDKPNTYTLQDHVNDVLALMNYYKIETTSLYGVSMGSYIAQGVAIKALSRIDKLILTVPKSNGLTSSTQRLMQEHAAELEGLNQQECDLALLKYMAYNPEILKENIHIFDTILTPEQVIEANQALSGFDFRPELSKIQAKTLIISGKYDGLNPTSEGKICASLIPNSTFIEMQYSGHIPVLEEPELYNNIIDSFLMS